VRTAVSVTGGRVPVFAGAGGPLPAAVRLARLARDAGAGGLLLMPPYLVDAPPSGLVAYTEAVAAATDLPVIVYQRGNVRFDPTSAVAVAALPTVAGFKDGLGDLDLMAQIVVAVREALPGKPFQFFNGMPTAEVTVPAYRGIGVSLYSSAAFCFAPEVSVAFHRAVADGDQAGMERLLSVFFHPLTRLRRKVPGYAVSLVKAGVRLRGLDAGRVRAPLTDPAPEHLAELRLILDAGLAAVREPLATATPAASGRATAHRATSKRAVAGQRHRISRVRITPVAFADPPLLNSVGVHEPFALRSVIEVVTDTGLTGLGETYADEVHLEALRAAARAIEGADPYQTEEIYRRVRGIAAPETTIASGLIGHSAATDRVFSPFEVACLDIQGQATGRPVADLLGGAVRSEVPFSAYLFYKWAAHPGADPDDWGEALDPDGIVAQARRLVDGYGFTALKLKGGVFPPEQEVEAIRALRRAFPDHPLRLDPNAAWTPRTSIGVARDLDGVLEYLEDPAPGIDGMAEVARQAPMPLATNMCVVAFGHLPPAIRQDAVQVILSDHHYWGGLRRSALLAGICETFGLGLSMHSNSHLGISLAAMVHLAAATPNLTYACDTHWPWKHEDVVAGQPFTFSGGSLPVPAAPGLGVELDRDALGRLHEQYQACGIRNRDDTGYMRRHVPGYQRQQPRW
jgi:glucarate dehydratase